MTNRRMTTEDRLLANGNKSKEESRSFRKYTNLFLYFFVLFNSIFIPLSPAVMGAKKTEKEEWDEMCDDWRFSTGGTMYEALRDECLEHGYNEEEGNKRNAELDRTFDERMAAYMEEQNNKADKSDPDYGKILMSEHITGGIITSITATLKVEGNDIRIEPNVIESTVEGEAADTEFKGKKTINKGATIDVAGMEIVSTGEDPTVIIKGSNVNSKKTNFSGNATLNIENALDSETTHYKHTDKGNKSLIAGFSEGRFYAGFQTVDVTVTEDSSKSKVVGSDVSLGIVSGTLKKINVIGSNLVASDTTDLEIEDGVTVRSAIEGEDHSSSKETLTTEETIGITNSVIAAGYKVKHLNDLREKLVAADKKVKDLENLRAQGKATDEAVNSALANQAILIANFAQMSYSLALTADEAATTMTVTAGFGLPTLDVTVTKESENSSSQQRHHVQSRVSLGKTNLKTKKIEVEGGVLYFDGDIETDETVIKSVKDTFDSKSNNSRASATASFGAEGPESLGINFSAGDSQTHQEHSQESFIKSFNSKDINSAKAGGPEPTNANVSTGTQQKQSQGSAAGDSAKAGGPEPTNANASTGDNQTNQKQSQEPAAGGNGKIKTKHLHMEGNAFVGTNELDAEEITYKKTEDKSYSENNGFSASVSAAPSQDSPLGFRPTSESVGIVDGSSEKTDLNNPTIASRTKQTGAKSDINRDESKRTIEGEVITTSSLDVKLDLDNRFLDTAALSRMTDAWSVETAKKVGKSLINNPIGRGIKNKYKETQEEKDKEANGGTVDHDKSISLIHLILEDTVAGYNMNTIQSKKKNLDNLKDKNSEEQRRLIKENILDHIEQNKGKDIEVVIIDNPNKPAGKCFDDPNSNRRIIVFNKAYLRDSSDLIDIAFHESYSKDRHKHNENTASRFGETAKNHWKMFNPVLEKYGKNDIKTSEADLKSLEDLEGMADRGELTANEYIIDSIKQYINAVFKDIDRPLYEDLTDDEKKQLLEELAIGAFLENQEFKMLEKIITAAGDIVVRMAVNAALIELADLVAGPGGALAVGIIINIEGACYAIKSIYIEGKKAVVTLMDIVTNGFNRKNTKEFFFELLKIGVNTVLLVSNVRSAWLGTDQLLDLIEESANKSGGSGGENSGFENGGSGKSGDSGSESGKSGNSGSESGRSGDSGGENSGFENGGSGKSGNSGSGSGKSGDSGSGKSGNNGGENSGSGNSGSESGKSGDSGSSKSGDSGGENSGSGNSGSEGGKSGDSGSGKSGNNGSEGGKSGDSGSGKSGNNGGENSGFENGGSGKSGNNGSESGKSGDSGSGNGKSDSGGSGKSGDSGGENSNPKGRADDLKSKGERLDELSKRIGEAGKFGGKVDAKTFNEIKSRLENAELNEHATKSIKKDESFHGKANEKRLAGESMIEGKTGIFNLKGGDGNPNYKLIQTEGSLDSKHHNYKGIYEYIMNDKGQITHERFVENGKITGTVGGGTGGGARK
ncbi:MAG: hypothetical protein LBI70_03675 [Rickettsiales bacterium]|jgi:hypothetical protein|nr:hypothetical protein [Rickettsiales bacterium]